MFSSFAWSSAGTSFPSIVSWSAGPFVISVSIRSESPFAEVLSKMLGRVAADAVAPSRLDASVLFLESKRLKSDVLGGRLVPPRIVSRAIWGTSADDLGARGQDPYQLRLLRTSFGPLDGVLGVVLCLTPLEVGISRCPTEDVVVSSMGGAGDVVAGVAGFGAGRLVELAVEEFGRTRFRGAMLRL